MEADAKAEAAKAETEAAKEKLKYEAEKERRDADLTNLNLKLRLSKRGWNMNIEWRLKLGTVIWAQAVMPKQIQILTITHLGQHE